MLIQPEILILSAGVFFGFVAQTIVGFAAALVAFPFLLTQYNLQEATVFLSLYYVVFSLVMVCKNYKDIDRAVFKNVAFTATLGYLVGFFILKVANPHILERILGGFVIIYSIYEWKYKKVFVIPTFITRLVGFVGGVVGGIFSSGNVIFGPLVSNRVKNGVAIRATLLAIFAIANFMRFPFVVVSGLFTWKIFINSLIIFPVFVLAIIVGHRIYKYVSEQLLRKLILLFLIISGVYLLFK